MTETAPAKVRVLIAADEPLARDRLRLLLADEDWTELVGQCPDGPAAVAAIEKLRPDLVFLDVQMPGATGLTSSRPSAQHSLRPLSAAGVRRARPGLPAEAF